MPPSESQPAPPTPYAGGAPLLTTPAPKRRRRFRPSATLVVALAFLAPNLLGFLFFTLFPVILSFGMAFTNWSLKPEVPLQFVGLRNFADLLAVRPLADGLPLVCALYVASAILLVVSLLGCVWAILSKWRGLRVTGLLLAAIGLAITAVGIFRHAPHGYYVVAAVLFVLALWVWSSEPERQLSLRPTPPGGRNRPRSRPHFR